MPKDRFAAHKARERANQPSDKEWEGGIIRTFLIQFAHPGIVCTECRMEFREGHTAAVYLNREGLRTYRHLMPDECQSLARIREARRLAREEQQLRDNQEQYTNMPSTNDPSVFAGFKHRDGLFVIKLADLCGWRIIIQQNGMGHAFAENGTDVRIPSNTGLRADIFKSWVTKIWTHTDRENRPSPLELLRLMADCKTDASTRKMLWKVFGVQAPQEPKPPPPPEPVAHTDVSGRQPYIVDQGPLLVKQGHKTQEHYSESVIKRTWSNGDVDYACSVCGIVKPSPNGITAHYKLHINDMRRAAVEELAKRPVVIETINQEAVYSTVQIEEAIASVALDGETYSVGPPAVAPQLPEMTDDEAAIVDLLLSLMRRASEKAAASNEVVADLRRRLADAETRATKAEGDLDALRDLLGVRKD